MKVGQTCPNAAAHKANRQACAGLEERRMESEERGGREESAGGQGGDSPLDTVSPGGVVHGDDAVPLRTDERHVVWQAKANLFKLCESQLDPYTCIWKPGLTRIRSVNIQMRNDTQGVAECQLENKREAAGTSVPSLRSRCPFEEPVTPRVLEEEEWTRGPKDLALRAVRRAEGDSLYVLRRAAQQVPVGQLQASRRITHRYVTGPALFGPPGGPLLKNIVSRRPGQPVRLERCVM